MNIRTLILIVAAGVVYGLAWSTETAGPVGLIGLALLFYQQSQTNRWWSAGLSALGAGMIAYLIACSWMPFTIQYLLQASETQAAVVAPLACTVQAGHFGVFGLLWFVARKQFSCGWVLAPVIWVSVEEIWPGFFPCKAGNLLTEFNSLCQLASFGGATLVSFQAAVIAGCMVLIVTWLWLGLKHQIWRKEYFRVAAVSAAAVFFSHLIGGERAQQWSQRLARSESSPPLRVLIVQVDTDQAECAQRMIEVSNQFRGKVDLVIWPECSLENYPQALTDFLDSSEYCDANGVSESYRRPYPQPAAMLLAGGDSWVPNAAAEDGRTHYISAYMINQQEQIVGRHDKVHLMPYGESIPGEQWLPVLRSWFGSERVLTSGTRYQPIGELQGLKIGTVLCCEDMQPEACRSMVAQGAHVIITLGSGSAFDSAVALQQHFRIAQLRAIENGRYFLRCTSRGVSGLIAPTGAVIGKLPQMQNLATPLQIPTLQLPTTLFTRWGYVGSYVSIFFGTLILVILSRTMTAKVSASQSKSNTVPAAVHIEMGFPKNSQTTFNQKTLHRKSFNRKSSQ